MTAKGFVMPTKEEVETYDALIAIQYSGTHFRSQMKTMAKRSRNKAVGRVLQSNPQRITVFMDSLNNPGIKVDGKDLFTVYPKGILWHEQDPNGRIEYTTVRLIKEIIEHCTSAEWDNMSYYVWRGYNTTFSAMNIRADNVDERVFTESGILQHTPKWTEGNSVGLGYQFSIVQIGEHYKGGSYYYNRTEENKIVQDHTDCEICTLARQLEALMKKEFEATDAFMLSQGGGSLAMERWFPYKEDFDASFVPTLIQRGMKVMKKA